MFHIHKDLSLLPSTMSPCGLLSLFMLTDTHSDAVCMDLHGIEPYFQILAADIIELYIKINILCKSDF